MANPEHLEILRQGVEKWNQWRKGHLQIKPEIIEAILFGANLSKANLSGEVFEWTIFSDNDLSTARGIRRRRRDYERLTF